MPKKKSRRQRQTSPRGPLNSAYRYERCPDCELEGRLKTVASAPPQEDDDRPPPPPEFSLRIGRVPLRKATKKFWRPSLSQGCETCGGTGRVERELAIDPMFLKKTL